MDSDDPSRHCFFIFLSVRYAYPSGFVPALARDAVLGRRRSFQKDSVALISQLVPPLNVTGEENIPRGGPCVVTVNHYFRPGFQAWWIALGIAACIPAEMHWMITGELTFPGKWYASLGKPVSKYILARLASVYGFTTMPPMPPRPKDVQKRARAVRKTLEVMRSGQGILGYAPEGGDQPAGRLSMPAPGAGRFGLLLAASGSMFVPIGAYEAGGAFCLRFGRAYELRVPSNWSADEKDRLAAGSMMEKIAELLPHDLRGDFS